MSRFHLVRAPIRLSDLDRWASERGWARRGNSRVGIDRGRALHHLLTEVFGPGVMRPFRLMVPPGSLSGNLYAYTHKDGEALRDAAAHFAWPDHSSVLDAAGIIAKPMPKQWREGQRLGFDVQTRPVRRVSRPIRTKEGKLVGEKPGGGPMELDAFRLKELRDSEAGITRQDVYLDWLAERLDSAARLDRSASRLVRYLRVPVLRGRKIIDGPDAVFHGELTVNDPVAFARLLQRGVGRHRAYGYGMVLLRPPQRASVRRTRN